MKHLRAIFSFVILASCMAQMHASSNADIPVSGSRSPDGTKDIVIRDLGYDGNAEGIAKIREVSTGKILGAFKWTGFGMHPDAKAFNVLWRGDSQCFAISWEFTRGFVLSAIYACWNGKWVKIELPDFEKQLDQKVRAAGKSHVRIYNDGGKGHETAKLWLPDGSLRLEAAYRNIVNMDSGDEQLFWITFEIGDLKGLAPPKAVLKDVSLAPETTNRG